MRSEPAPATEGHTIRWARLYDALFGRLLRASDAWTIEAASIRPGERVLDVGCGPGRLTLAIRRHAGPGSNVCGVDAAPEMIAVARRNAAQARLEVRFDVGLAEALPFPAGSFDVVVSRLAVHHFPGDLKRRAFAEMARVLRPGGRCVAVDFEPPLRGLRRALAKTVVNRLMMATDVCAYAPMMEEAGFTAVETGATRSRFLSFVRGRVPETAAGA